jgi:hypothetical protein
MLGMWDRFCESIQLNDLTGCWLWKASMTHQGYGSFHWKGKGRVAHRWSYEFFRGPIPTGLVLDHLCRCKSCVNPFHLEAVTNRENILRGTAPPAKNARVTHCPRGHEYGPYVPGKGRTCKNCARDRNKTRFRDRAAEYARWLVRKKSTTEAA